MKKRISEEEVNRLYSEYSTPPNVIRHCKAVTRVAETLSRALNGKGYSLDLDLVRGAGLSHDVARTYDRHWDVMADKLEEMGYPDEAFIVREHMLGDSYHEIENITEQDMIWLGDRLVKEDQYVGIDERFEYIIDKALKMGAEDHVPHILESKAKMKRLLDDIEDVIGQSVDSLFEEEFHYE